MTYKPLVGTESLIYYTHDRLVGEVAGLAGVQRSLNRGIIYTRLPEGICFK